MKNLFLLSILAIIFNSPISAFQPPERMTVIDDFELMSLPMGMANGLNVGFLTFQGNNSSINLNLTDAPPVQVPGSDPDNRVICATMTIPPVGFAGFIHNFTNDAADTWVSMDWSTYEGIQLWIYGNNTGGTLFLDILENRKPGSVTDDAERWTVEMTDDFSGWQLFQFMWEDFSRKNINNDAPDDGFTLTEVYGYAVGGFGSVDMGENSYYVDGVAIWGERAIVVPLEVGQFASSQYQVIEGETAQIEVVINNTSMDPVTFTYATAESTAIPDRDFLPVMGQVTIAPGMTSATFPVATIDNNKYEGNRSVMIDIKEIDGAEPGFLLKTRLTILDNESEDVGLIDDFEGCHPYRGPGSAMAEVIELSISDDYALPCQDEFEHVVEASGSGSLSRTFSQSQDWSDSTGLSLWFYGTGSGETITVNILDNRSNNTSNTSPEDWVLVWSDEFNDPAGTTPNPNIWKPELGDGSLNGILGWGNAELQYYTNDPANASTDGSGNMVITSRNVDTDNSDLLCWYGPCEYTSARLNTKDKLDFQYGRIEARVLVPDGAPGLWPAFWSLGADIDENPWPGAGEIDIMEYVSRQPNQIFGTMHGPGYSGGGSFGSIYDLGSPVYNGYHTYTIEWIEDEIRWYFDGIAYHSATPSDVNPNEWVFNKPFFVLLNMAIGGNFGGGVSDLLTLPQQMLIDYVRVYQAESSSERFESSFTDDSYGWQLIYLPFSGFSRSSDQPDGAPDDGLGLDEVWGYELHLPEVQSSNGGYLFDQIRLTDGRPEPPCFIPPIPTLSQWGILVLGVLIMIIGIVVIRQRKTIII